MNRKLYLKFKKNPNINPLTGRKIKTNGTIYKKLMKECNKFNKQKTQKGGYKSRALTSMQKKILNNIKNRAKRQSNYYEDMLEEKFINAMKKLEEKNKGKISSKSYKQLLKEFLNYIKKDMVLTLHFSGDLMDKLTETGRIKSAFEIAEASQRGEDYMKGRTDAEEEQLGYAVNTKPIDRPKYGCFNILKSAKGCAASYGEYWLTLSPKILNRVTFTPGDSLNVWQKENSPAEYGEEEEDEENKIEASDIGTPEYMNHILYKNWKPNVFKNFIHKNVNNKVVPKLVNAYDNDYIEVQIHGDISLKEDIVSLHYPEFGLYNKAKLFCENFNCKTIEITKTPNEKIRLAIGNINVKQVATAIELGGKIRGLQSIEELVYDGQVNEKNFGEVKQIIKLLMNKGLLKFNKRSSNKLKDSYTIVRARRRNRKWGLKVLDELKKEIQANDKKIAAKEKKLAAEKLVKEKRLAAEKIAKEKRLIVERAANRAAKRKRFFGSIKKIFGFKTGGAKKVKKNKKIVKKKRKTLKKRKRKTLK